MLHITTPLTHTHACIPHTFHVFRQRMLMLVDWGTQALWTILCQSSGKGKDSDRGEQNWSCTFCGWNSGSITQVAPTQSGHRSLLTMPWTWWSGKVWRMTSSPDHPHSDTRPWTWERELSELRLCFACNESHDQIHTTSSTFRLDCCSTYFYWGEIKKKEVKIIPWSITLYCHNLVELAYDTTEEGWQKI